jgi:sugar phosphate isomerase/epimerase
MRLSGFTDEASDNLEGQIKATKALGWDYLSARTFNGQNIHDVAEHDFEIICEQFETNDIKVAEFGTLIGSWGKTISSDWAITLKEIERCIPRMQKLSVKYARIMSYAQNPWGEAQYDQERFKRLREITQRFEDAGLVALHENCMNWGGFSAEHSLKLLDEVPNLKLIFDTGNPIFQRDRSKPEPQPWQDSIEFYNTVKHAVAHVHIKDAHMPLAATEPVYTFPGDGDANLKAILKDLIKSDYDGFIAIEPHVGKVFHDPEANKDEDHAFDLYVQYGRAFEKLIEKIKDGISAH